MKNTIAFVPRIEIRVFDKAIVRLRGQKSKPAALLPMSAQADNRPVIALEFIPGRFYAKGLFSLLVGVTCLASALVQAAPIPVVSVQKDAGGVTLRMQPGTMRLQVCAPRVIRVTYSPTETLPKTKSLSVIAIFAPIPFHLVSNAQSVTVNTGQLQAQVSRATGAVRFMDAKGRPILSETPGGGKTLTPTTLAGPTPEAAYQSQQRFVLPADESIYGLGQHQDGYMDYRHSVVTLEQQNREVAIPFLVSSHGYGLLWDNPAFTKVSVGTEDFAPIPASHLRTRDGTFGGLTGEYFQGQDLKTLVTTRTDPQVDFNWTGPPAPGLGQENFSVRWSGSVQANLAGDYVFSTGAMTASGSGLTTSP